MNAALISLLILVSVPPPGKEVSLLDFWRGRCAAGDAEACDRVAAAQPGVDLIERLDAYAVEFAASVDRAAMQEGRRPRLDRAYAPALAIYFRGEQAAQRDVTVLDDAALAECGSHYHSHWVERKLWWPTDDTQQPDWQAIYYFIVDHYLGVCLKRRY